MSDRPSKEELEQQFQLLRNLAEKGEPVQFDALALQALVKQVDFLCFDLAAAKERENQMAESLLECDSMLSLLVHRAGIQTWGEVGMATREEAETVYQRARKLWNDYRADIEK